MKRAVTLLIFLLFTTFSFGQLIINEVLYDPSNNALDGDANGDGTYDQEDDSFIEFVNIGTTNFDASGYEVWDDTTSGSLKFVIPQGTLVPPNGALVVFGSSPLVGSFGNALVFSADTTPSHLNFNNSGEVIGIKDPMGSWVLIFDSDALSNNPNESYTRFPDITGNFLQHGDTTAVLFSPGTRTDGTPFDTNIVVESIMVQGAGGQNTITTNGGTLQMEAIVMPASAADKTVTWSVPAGNGVATIDPTGLLTPAGNGSIFVKATANDGTGVTDSTEITVSNQTIGIEESSISSLKVYPNPVIDVLNIESEVVIDQVEIISITGQMVDQMIPKQNQINLAKLSTGVYFLKIKSGSKETVVRVTKQ